MTKNPILDFRLLANKRDITIMFIDKIPIRRHSAIHFRELYNDYKIKEHRKNNKLVHKYQFVPETVTHLAELTFLQPNIDFIIIILNSLVYEDNSITGKHTTLL